jgi:hypothetical protein
MPIDRKKFEEFQKAFRGGTARSKKKPKSKKKKGG